MVLVALFSKKNHVQSRSSAMDTRTGPKSMNSKQAAVSISFPTSSARVHTETEFAIKILAAVFVG